MTHTPTPWAMFRDMVVTANGDGTIPINSKVVMDFPNAGNDDEANAAFIVKAVNAHDELVEALRDLLDDVECGRNESGALIEARRVLKKVQS